MVRDIRTAQDRLVLKRWGVFHHYLWNPKVHADEADMLDWSRTIDRFDVEKLAATLHEIGAGYYCITLIHGTEYMITPNPTYEKICGVAPNTLCPRRDLVSDLYDALSAYDIDLYLYCNAYTPLFREIPAEYSLGFAPERDWHCHADPSVDGMPYTPTLDFAENWASVIEDTAVRYGEKISGWWLDSCYNFVGYKFETLAPLYRAIKKGNPYALSAFNNGVKDGIEKWYPMEEMTCGERNTFDYVPKSRFIDGAQSHMLIPLGYLEDGNPAGWGTRTCKCDHVFLSEYLRKLEAVGCPLSIDVYVEPDGSFDPTQLEVLRGL